MLLVFIVYNTRKINLTQQKDWKLAMKEWFSFLLLTYSAPLMRFSLGSGWRQKNGREGSQVKMKWDRPPSTTITTPLLPHHTHLQIQIYMCTDSHTCVYVCVQHALQRQVVLIDIQLDKNIWGAAVADK